MRATNTLTGQLGDGKQQKIKEGIMQRAAANNQQPVLGKARQRCGGCRHCLLQVRQSSPTAPSSEGRNAPLPQNQHSAESLLLFSVHQ